jgi:peptidoglycan/xylan/chitin deacetylase (PgdA/CDA1 family)
MGHQRRLQGAVGRSAARLDRLQRVPGLVAAGSDERQGEAESDLPVHEWHHPAIRKALFIGSAAAAAAWWTPALAPIVPGVAEALGLPRRIDDPAGVALTFDDGPHPEGTPAVLEALEVANANATFFLCGEQVERYPALAAELVAAGHTAAVHGYTHRNMLRLAPRTFVQDLERGIAAIEDAIGSSPELYRPPYGIFSYPGMLEVKARGLRSLLWSRWGHDWRAARTPAEIAGEATRELDGGEVLLLHDADHYSAPGSWRRTVEALPMVIERIRSAGLRPVIPS